MAASLTHPGMEPAKYRARAVRRFWSQVLKGADCWLWTGRTDADGYGRFYWYGRNVRATRVALELAGRPLRDGEEGCHRCDHPRCVRHDHLFGGTKADNRADCVAKRRHAKGERQHLARLTEEQALSILASSESDSVLAARFGVARATVNHVRCGRTWKHVFELRGRP